MATPAADGSCTGKILESLLDATDHLASAGGFGSSDPDDWRWGALHTLTMNPLFPNSDLQVPEEGEPGAENGFPRAGDNFVINRADCGWADLGFAQHADGPAQRFLAEAEMNGTVRLRWALPGGTIYDRDSPHYRDLLDEYYLQNRHFDAPYSTPEIIAAGEERWVFH
jgi:penicillin amidase